MDAGEGRGGRRHAADIEVGAEGELAQLGAALEHIRHALHVRDIPGREVEFHALSTLEHRIHAGDVLGVEVLDALQRSIPELAATVEHIRHVRHLRGVEARERNAAEVRATIEHIGHVRHVGCARIVGAADRRQLRAFVEHI